MINLLVEMFSFPFLVRAVTVGLLVSLCASLLGVSLSLRHFSLIGDGLSHVGFGSLAVAFALHTAPLTIAIPVCVLAAFLLLKIDGNSSISGDAAIALISSGALAIGVMTVSLTTGMNTDVCNYMFGSILALSKADARLSIILSIAVIILFTVCYLQIFAITFDETFAKATGIKTGIYNSALAVCTALTVVLGMRMMGALLISSLIIFPAMSAMRIFKRFSTVTIASVIISVVCFITGMILSYKFNIPSGAGVVCVNIVFFALSFCIGKLIAVVQK
jgi:zinc transport system permease protein